MLYIDILFVCFKYIYINFYPFHNLFRSIFTFLIQNHNVIKNFLNKLLDFSQEPNLITRLIHTKYVM